MLVVPIPTPKDLTILMLKGLPASGKTTFARELVVSQGFKRVNRDDLRAMVDDGIYSQENESLIVNMQNALIGQALADNKNVVVDNTNLNPANERQLRRLAENWGVKFEVKEFDTDLKTCIERDAKRPQPVGEKVIMDMYNKYFTNPN